MSAVMYTTQQKATPIAVSRLEQLSKIFLMIGLAPSVA